MYCHIIYLIQCKLCNLQYVGETQNPLHICLNGHRSDIKNKNNEKPVAVHFNSPGHKLSDLTILVLEQMRSNSPDLRKLRESYWIHHLHSIHPSGMNLDP